ncbi:hypothetical protein RF55_12138 [Lasius niger]|uniref:Uncharacterized protein n=1 Tax=Lasius niger TaxID=67767 RepID=A0A0J7KDW1_LASNI|nr:hypothetical protein RF55_12138 [Lasius niger]
MECPRCGSELTLNLETLLFRCRKSYNAVQPKKKKKMMRCDFWRSVKVNTWFDYMHLPTAYPETGAHTQGIERTWRECVCSRPERINVFFDLIAEFQEVLVQDKVFDGHVDTPQDA